MGVSSFEGILCFKYTCTRTTLYLAVQTDCEQHQEEENSPQWGDGELGHSLRVRHEGQSGTLSDDILDVNARLVRHES